MTAAHRENRRAVTPKRIDQANRSRENEFDILLHSLDP
jgi:hypothetical protein